MAKNPRLIDLAGQKFGDWSVLAKAGNSPRGAALWLARCACGAQKAVAGTDLRNGKSTNCGCLKAAKIGELRKTHGETGTRLHRIWKNMRARCYRETHPQYPDYGGRGIVICQEWQSFSGFRDWALANGYADGLSIDRKDNYAGYSAENCRWTTAKVQSRNRRMVALAADGRPGPEVAEANGIPIGTYNVRRAAGWSVDEAATWPHGMLRQPRPRDEGGRYSG